LGNARTETTFGSGEFGAIEMAVHVLYAFYIDPHDNKSQNEMRIRSDAASGQNDVKTTMNSDVLTS
jgi:hypothetical protein